MERLQMVRGVTLVEVIIVAAIVLGLVGGLLFVLANAGQKAWTGTEARLVNLTQAQSALDRVSDEVRGACAATIACGANQISFRSGPTCTQVVTYTLAGSNLTRQVDAAAAQVVTAGLTASSATPPGFTTACLSGGHLVQLQVASQATSGTFMRAQALESQVWVANP